MTKKTDYERLETLLSTNESPMLGPQRREDILPVRDIREKLDALLEASNVSGVRGDLARSLTLLWHDHLDASHTLSQSISSADGSYVHGIMHRREPDFGNAAYWFRKVGDHPIFPELAEAVSMLNADSTFTSRLVNDGEWNPFAMIDACEAVEVGSADEGDEAFLREVQALEFHLLLRRFCEM